jgi:uncharacterized NAD-dependent epimerase/dehydratase family protein
VLCHEAGRETISGWPHFRLPDLDEAIALHERLARRTNPAARCVGIAVNTSGLPQAERGEYLAALHREHGVPAVDPLIDGCEALVEYAREAII